MTHDKGIPITTRNSPSKRVIKRGKSNQRENKNTEPSPARSPTKSYNKHNFEPEIGLGSGLVRV